MNKDKTPFPFEFWIPMGETDKRNSIISNKVISMLTSAKIWDKKKKEAESEESGIPGSVGQGRLPCKTESE